MEDTEIIDLYFARSEDAIVQTARKYGDFCRHIAGSILRSREDRDECVSEAYYKLWQTIPPEKPQSLRAYLASVTRSVSLTRWRREHAEKRGGGAFLRSLDELAECVPGADDTGAVADRLALKSALEQFLSALKPVDRRVFLQRYWYFRTVAEIANDCGLGESAVKVSLHRSREKLRKLLEQEGIVL